jgi:hypothetical protein
MCYSRQFVHVLLERGRRGISNQLQIAAQDRH